MLPLPDLTQLGSCTTAGICYEIIDQRDLSCGKIEKEMNPFLCLFVPKEERPLVQDEICDELIPNPTDCAELV